MENNTFGSLLLLLLSVVSSDGSGTYPKIGFLALEVPWTNGLIFCLIFGIFDDFSKWSVSKAL